MSIHVSLYLVYLNQFYIHCKYLCFIQITDDDNDDKDKQTDEPNDIQISQFSENEPTIILAGALFIFDDIFILPETTRDKQETKKRQSNRHETIAHISNIVCKYSNHYNVSCFLVGHDFSFGIDTNSSLSGYLKQIRGSLDSFTFFCSISK